jgi:hypothetical protein
MTTAMRPLSALPVAVRRSIRGVLTDIDDTLSTQGRVTGEAYTAMARLRSAGLLVIRSPAGPRAGAITSPACGPSMRWSARTVRYMMYDEKARKLRKRYVVDEAGDEPVVNASHRLPRASCARYRLRTRVRPGVPESDLAIDYCEDVAPLPPSEVDRIVALMRAEGLTARVSSVHVNGWFGDYDKLAMTRTLLREEFGVDLDARRQEYVFVGDSPNDASMFDFFPNAVGVANVRRLADRIATPPKYVTLGEAGAGFAELVASLLAARGG